MIEKYTAIKKKKYKYFREVPYITNKEFKSIRTYSLLGETRLQKNKKRPNRKYLYYKRQCYIVKNKMLGVKKGYIDVGGNNYLVLKDNRLFILLLLFIFILSLFIPLNKENAADLHPNHEPKKHLVKGEISNDKHTKDSSVVVDKNHTSNIKRQKYLTKANLDSHTICFDSNGGYGVMKDIKYFEGQSITLEKNSFTRLGYTFLGWSTKRDGNIIYQDQELISSLDSNDDNNTTVLYALWKRNTYHISYELNGGVLENLISSYHIESNISIDHPLKKGYTFLGWRENNRNPLIKNYTLSYGKYGDIQLEANYTPNQYKIHFETNGAYEDYEDKMISYEEEYGFLPTPTKKGYTFLGWMNSQGNLVDQSTIYQDTNDIILEAKWLANDYTITLNAQGGNLDITTLFISYGSQYKNLPIPTRLGYSFDGWYYKGILVDNDSIMDRNFDHELYAKWKINTYQVTYLHPNNTTYATREVTYFDYIPLLDYSLDNYHIFNGWYDTNGNNISGRKNLTSNLVVQANIREANCYLITGKAQDGDTSRIARFSELLAHKGLGGRWNLDSSGYYDYVSNASNYSHIRDSANYLLANAPSNSYPYLKFLGMFCENGYAESLR